MNPDPARPAIPQVPAQRKVFDVSRPGRAQPNSTSKPVIVGHRPVVSDPAVTMNGIGARPMMNSHKKISITSHDDTPAQGVPAAKTQPTPVPPAATPTPPEYHAEPSPIRTHAAAAFPSAGASSALSPALVAAATAADPAPMSPPKPSVMPWALPSAKPAPAVTPAAEVPDPAAHASAPAIPIDITADDATPDDDLLAAMPAPSVGEHEEAPMVSQQVGPKEFPWKWVVPIIIIVYLAIAIVDILLDADFLSWDVPHTHFF
ncbi:MAG: hypothetical protein ABWY71_02290 [Candidatus Saccharimonadales bacterium]